MSCIFCKLLKTENKVIAGKKASLILFHTLYAITLLTVCTTLLYSGVIWYFGDLNLYRSVIFAGLIGGLWGTRFSKLWTQVDEVREPKEWSKRYSKPKSFEKHLIALIWKTAFFAIVLCILLVIVI